MEDSPSPISVDHSHMVLIVVGSHLRAEQSDRPLAYRLQHRMERWIAKHETKLNVPIEPIVCSDVWYLNNEPLQHRPTVCIGGPGVNALSAFFAQHLPSRPDEDQQVIIQIDPDYTDLRVCIWGTNAELTGKGVDLFARRYLDGFLRGVATQVIPAED